MTKYRTAHFDKDDNFIQYSFWGTINEKGEPSNSDWLPFVNISGSVREVHDAYTGHLSNMKHRIYVNDILRTTQRWNDIEVIVIESKGRYMAADINTKEPLGSLEFGDYAATYMQHQGNIYQLPKRPAE